MEYDKKWIMKEAHGIYRRSRAIPTMKEKSFSQALKIAWSSAKFEGRVKRRLPKETPVFKDLETAERALITAESRPWGVSNRDEVRQIKDAIQQMVA